MSALPVFLYDISCRYIRAARTIAIANGRGEHEESDIRAAGGVAACVNLMFEFLVRAPGRYLRSSHRPRMTDGSKG